MLILVVKHSRTLRILGGRKLVSLVEGCFALRIVLVPCCAATTVELKLAQDSGRNDKLAVVGYSEVLLLQ